MNDKEDDFPFPRSPMGYHNRYMRDGKHAPFAICGSEPNGKGGGVLFWAYTSDEANQAYDAYRACGYRNVALVEDVDVSSICEEKDGKAFDARQA